VFWPGVVVTAAVSRDLRFKLSANILEARPIVTRAIDLQRQKVAILKSLKRWTINYDYPINRKLRLFEGV